MKTLIYGFGPYEEFDSNISESIVRALAPGPGVITEDYEFVTPQDCDYRFDVGDGRKYIVNVSSVGQPRDGDNRACYATVDGNVVIFHRLEYDYATTMDKIVGLACVDRVCADRLAVGR